MDSLFNHFIKQNGKKMIPSLTIGTNNFKPAPSLDLQAIPIEHYLGLKQTGMHLLKTGKGMRNG
jgi:hypothetical protein